MLNTSPLPGFIQIKMESPKVGVLDTSSRKSAVECAEVIAIGGNGGDFLRKGNDLIMLLPGDKIFIKSWAVDTVVYEGEEYQYINIETNGVLAKINDLQQ